MRSILTYVVLGLIIRGHVLAADTPVSFDSTAQRQRYDTLLQELRCLVCQNQSLADSHADLAQDLRDEVYRMVTAGQERQDIIDFMVARYGDFVLYKPPVKSSTWLLWFGPALLLLLAIAMVIFNTRARGQVPPALSEDERARVRQLVDRDAG